MLNRDYLHERAEESRHKETQAYLMFVAGVILLTGGILETLFCVESPSWLLFLPYSVAADPASMLGLLLVSSGIGLAVLGIAYGLFYDHDRKWYMAELKKNNSVQTGILLPKARKKKARKRAIQ